MYRVIFILMFSSIGITSFAQSDTITLIKQMLTGNGQKRWESRRVDITLGTTHSSIILFLQANPNIARWQQGQGRSRDMIAAGKEYKWTIEKVDELDYVLVLSPSEKFIIRFISDSETGETILRLRKQSTSEISETTDYYFYSN